MKKHHTPAVIPAVIPESFVYLKNTLASVEAYTRTVQVDIVDGRFVPFISWPYKEDDVLSDMKQCTEAFEVEVDLMVLDPGEVIDAYADSGVKRIIVHLESARNVESILEHRRSHTYELAFSVNNDTPLEALFAYVGEIDFVQLMGIREIGSQGQPFDSRVLERIQTLRVNYPELIISVDGSVNAETLPLLREAGADRFVSGSAILHSENPEDTFVLFERMAAGDL